MLIDAYRSIMCLFIVAILCYWYIKKREKIVELIFLAFALKYFSVRLIGPTIDVLYLLCLFITGYEIVKYGVSIKIKPKIAIAFILPFAIFLCSDYLFVVTGLNNGLNPIAWILKTCLNYIKIFLIFYFVGVAVAKQASKIKIDDVFNTILKITFISCCISAFQLFLFIILYNQETILQLFGIAGGHSFEYPVGSINFVRLQAFFYEPKSFAAFLALAIPIALHKKKIVQAICFFVAGCFTLSQTFFVILITAVFIFILFKWIKSVRLNIIATIGSIILIFLSIASARELIIEKYADAQDNFIYKIFVERAVSRYNFNEDLEEKNELWGIPLQKDIELPAVNFLSENPVFLLTGFGTGNYNTIPREYFTSKWNLDALEEGTFKGHFDMGWIFLIAENGLIYFIFLFLILTPTVPSGFNAKFYSFLWLVFFFHRIDILLIVFFVLISYKRKVHENIYSNNII